jgi:DNA topoisomerase VI subunit B
MSLLAHRNNLHSYSKERKQEAEDKRAYINTLMQEIDTLEQVAQVYEQEWKDTSEALSKIMEPLSLDDTVELMTSLSFQSAEEYSDAMMDYRPNDIITQLLFNGKLKDA